MSEPETSTTEVEWCDRCGEEIGEAALERGWPVPTLDDKYVGPCCLDGYCPEGHILRGDTESPACADCRRDELLASPLYRVSLDDDGGSEEFAVSCDADAFEYAREYARDGSWGDITSTIWIGACVWRLVVDEDGDDAWEELDTISVEINPEVPECVDSEGDIPGAEYIDDSTLLASDDDDGHRWRSPHELLGGLKENPGVWGHGGGVIVTEVCMRCGCQRTTDTWAQDRTSGQQGLTSVEHEAGVYSGELATYRRKRAEWGYSGYRWPE